MLLCHSSKEEISCTSVYSAKTQALGKGSRLPLFATDRADRKTYIAQGWIVTDRVRWQNWATSRPARL